MTPFVQTATDLLSFGTLLSDILIVFLLLIFLTPLNEKGWGRKVSRFFGNHSIFFSFLIAGGSVVGSLFYSEFAHFAPCELCWVQRAFLYTEAVILAVTMIARRAEKRKAFEAFARHACLWLSVIQFPISAYHEYLQFGGGDLIPCSATGVSCNYVYFVEYGYITIPAMALTAAAFIIVLMLLKEEKVAEGEN